MSATVEVLVCPGGSGGHAGLHLLPARSGEIQKIVRVKTNTADIRSATFIDLFYGLVLLTFKFDTFGIGAKVPMSTTWVFLGHAGRPGGGAAPAPA